MSKEEITASLEDLKEKVKEVKYLEKRVERLESTDKAYFRVTVTFFFISIVITLCRELLPLVIDWICQLF